MGRIIKFTLWLVFTAALVVAAVVAGAYWWAIERPVTMHSNTIDYLIEPGSTPRGIARVLNDSGIELPANAFVIMARLSGLDKQLKAGAYEAKSGDSPWQIMQRMAQGDTTHVRLTFPEGWTFKQIRNALDNSSQVRHDSLELDDKQLLAKLGINDLSAEGLFYPDTYVFAPGSSDLDILRRAYSASQQILEQAWQQRSPDLPLKNPYEALILASIIEKETGHGLDRGKVAGVFINRLRNGMPLQTDPTVIYGMGEAYNGRIRKKDLERDTPWNTYTRNGLPPTPIASPGKAALEAALHPQEHKYLYFVARGDGTSEFSTNLNAHNKAVRKFILKRN